MSTKRIPNQKKRMHIKDCKPGMRIKLTEEGRTSSQQDGSQRPAKGKVAKVNKETITVAFGDHVQEFHPHWFEPDNSRTAKRWWTEGSEIDKYLHRIDCLLEEMADVRKERDEAIEAVLSLIRENEKIRQKLEQMDKLLNECIDVHNAERRPKSLPI